MKKLIQYFIGYIKCKIANINSAGYAYIALNVKVINWGRIKLGKNVTIRPSSHIYVSSTTSFIEMGNYVEIGNHSTISAFRSIIIEDGVLTGPHVYIADHNHRYLNPNVHIYKQGVMAEENSCVHIGEGTWLGTNVVVSGNVKIGKQCVIGANSVVTKDIPDYSIAAGSPCKVIKRYNFELGQWERVM